MAWRTWSCIPKVTNWNVPDRQWLVKPGNVHLRNAKAGYHGLEILIKQDVFRVDVVVDNRSVASVMQVAETLGQADGDGNRLRPAQWLLAPLPPVQPVVKAAIHGVLVDEHDRVFPLDEV